MPRTVVGLFRDYNEAEAVVHDLARHGFDSQQVSLIANDQSGRLGKVSAKHSQSGADVGTGAALGGAAGLMLGLAALAIPGVGPVVAAGPLAAALTAAGIGAAAGGMVAVLKEAGVPEARASSYADSIRDGGTLLVVKADDPNKAEDARSVLDRHGAMDVHAERSDERRVETSSTDPHVDAQTFGDEGSPSGIGSAAYSSDRRDPRLYERNPRGYDRERDVVPDVSDDAFRKHWESTFAGHGTYDKYSEAYRYGATLGAEPRYRSADWSTIEADARRRWESDHPGSWSGVKDAIRHAWDHVRGKA